MTRPPPEIPSMPAVQQQLVDYLRKLRTWAYEELDKKVDPDVAVQHVTLYPSDQKTPTTVLSVSATAAGALTATPQALGGGKP